MGGNDRTEGFTRSIHHEERGNYGDKTYPAGRDCGCGELHSRERRPRLAVFRFRTGLEGRDQVERQGSRAEVGDEVGVPYPGEAEAARADMADGCRPGQAEVADADAGAAATGHRAWQDGQS